MLYRTILGMTTFPMPHLGKVAPRIVILVVLVRYELSHVDVRSHLLIVMSWANGSAWNGGIESYFLMIILCQ